jgi:hypothetical protein
LNNIAKNNIAKSDIVTRVSAFFSYTQCIAKNDIAKIVFLYSVPVLALLKIALL